MADKKGQAAVKVDQLFKELQAEINDSQYQKAVETANKILQVAPNDEDAWLTKGVSLIKLGSWDDAVAHFSSKKQKYGFELAYIYYRQRKYKEALSALSDVPQNRPDRSLLEAQVLYRLEEFEKSIKLYEEIIAKKSSISARTNLVAAYISAHNPKDALRVANTFPGDMEDSFEFVYNASCACLEQGDLVTAEKYLKLAEKMCVTSLTEEEASQEEIDDETAVIRVQLAYVYQLQKKLDDALKLNSDILKTKPTDTAVTAVANNNVVSLRKDHDLFDSAKKIKAASAPELELKLSKAQRFHINFNHALILLRMNKTEQCREMINNLQTEFPANLETFDPVLIDAFIYIKDKNIPKAEEVLERAISRNTQNSEFLRLCLAQVYLTRNNNAKVISILGSMDKLKHKPAVLATRVKLLSQTGDNAGALKAIDEAIDYWSKAGEGSKETLVKVLKGAAQYKLAQKKYSEAANLYERLLKFTPNDQETILSLVVAYSYYDTAAAAAYERQLPSLKANVDVDALESAPSYKAAKLAVQDKTEAENANSQEKTLKKKRKKKKRLPKNYNPNVPYHPNQERWLPLRERSSYRKKQKSTIAGKHGTQGGMAVDSKAAAALVKGPSSATSTSSSTPASSAAPAAPAVSSVGKFAPPGAKQGKGKRRR